MKQKITLGGSISILIGVVIAILALLRGPAQTVLLLVTFALWGLWLLLALLRPAWRVNRIYRSREEREAREQGILSGKNIAQLLRCHVNCRITDCLKSTYPNASWEWTMNDPILLIAQGGTGRIQVYGVKDYEYADVTLDQKGGLSCSMVKLAPVRNGGQNDPSGKPVLNLQAWYELEGRTVLESLIADLRTRGHSSLTVNEDGSISFQPEPGKSRTVKQRLSNLPEKVYWNQLTDVLRQEGLTADVQADKIAVSW